MLRKTLWLPLLVALGCSGIDVDRDYDRAVNFQELRTFRIEGGETLVEGRADTRDTLLRDRLTRAISEELEAQGMTATDSDPDVLVYYVEGARTERELEQAYNGYGWGFGPGWYRDDFWVREYQEGTLVIDLVDAQTHKLLWRAYTTVERNNLRDPKLIREMTRKAFEKYPPSPPKAPDVG